MTEKEKSGHYRKPPGQARSRETVEAILAASTRLLETEGLPNFNTNAVAKAAGVNVATVYHYFPDKVAILRELFDRNEAQRTELARPQWERLAEAEDLDAWIGETIEVLTRLRRNQPAGVALRRACLAIPDMMEADDQANAAMADVLADALARRFPHLGPDQRAVAARTLIELSTGLLHAAGATPAIFGAVVTELHRIMRGYLAELARSPTP